MQIHPLRDYVLVDIPDLKDTEKKLESGLIIAEKEEKKLPIRGKVLEVGPGGVSNTGMTIYPPVQLVPGVTIFFEAYHLEKIELSHEETHCLVKVEHIVAYSND